MKHIPVIFDTDLGHDIDDSWALAMLLKSPELDLKMVLTDSGDTRYRAAIAAKMLMAAGRPQVPIGIGIPFEDRETFLQEWVADDPLGRYPGPVHQDGVAALVDLVMESPEVVTVVAVSPAPNLAEALTRQPAIAEKIRVVGMFGSIAEGYATGSPPVAEANVARHTAACQKIFREFPKMTITPLDTCGRVVLDGDAYRRVAELEDPLIQSVMEQYRLWSRKVTWARGIDTQRVSSTLFDTVAVYLAYAEEFLGIENLELQIGDDGFTSIRAGAKKVRVATTWKDLPAFIKHLETRLLSPLPSLG